MFFPIINSPHFLLAWGNAYYKEVKNQASRLNIEDSEAEIVRNPDKGLKAHLWQKRIRL